MKVNEIIYFNSVQQTMQLFFTHFTIFFQKHDNALNYLILLSKVWMQVIC